MDIGIKSIMLAGIGGIAYAYEKSMSMAEELVQKGELTVGLGKQMNGELKRNIQAEGTLTPETLNQLKVMIAGLNLATKEDISLLNQRITVLESR